jgi:hypothetical protein
MEIKEEVHEQSLNDHLPKLNTIKEFNLLEVDLKL